MYNNNLEMIQTFGQENSAVPFFCSLKIDQFLVSYQYFIINEPFIDEDDDDYNKVTIINRSNGIVEGAFKIYEPFHQIKVFLDKYLITFDNEACLLKCYNFKGGLLGEIDLPKKLEGSFLNVLNKEICFGLNSINKIFLTKM
jgi:hypothetical protein